MVCTPLRWKWLIVGTILACSTGARVAWAQAEADVPKTAHRRLAPGVMQSVLSKTHAGETYAHHDMVELLAVDPSFDWAKDITFRRDIWSLDFQFKPVRMIYVDIPQANGRMAKQLVWYLLYSVTNSGKVLHPSEKEDMTYEVVEIDKAVRFIPNFFLEDPETGTRHAERVIPLAINAIRRREDPTRQIFNTATISGDIPPGKTVWGAATWTNPDPKRVDPLAKIDRFSLYILGLTNAYQWVDKPGAYKSGDPLLTGRTLSHKTLKVNFWRPGDEYYQHEKEIRYGQPGEVDYEWIYQ